MISHLIRLGAYKVFHCLVYTPVILCSFGTLFICEHAVVGVTRADEKVYEHLGLAADDVQTLIEQDRQEFRNHLLENAVKDLLNETPNPPAIHLKIDSSDWQEIQEPDPRLDLARN